MENITYEGFHGTKKENIKSICENNFILNNDIENNLFLGAGAYFFVVYEDAVDWNIKNFFKNKNKKPEYCEIKKEYSTVKANIDCNSNDVLDLDNKEMLYKLELLLKKVQGKLVTKQEYIKARNKTCAIINMLYKRKILKRNIIIKTFIETININKNLATLKNYPRKMLCVKNNNFIKNIEEYDILTEEVFNSIIYFY